jgi:hypothetical protein
MKLTDPANFKGTNKLSAMTSYYYRLLYTVVHEPGAKYKGNISKNVHDFERGERMLYGRVLNRTWVPIVLKERNLQAPKNQSGPQLVRVFSFVADAFNDFMDAFDTAQFKNQISADAGWLNSPRPKRGHRSATRLYRNYREASFAAFMDHLDNNKLHSKIHDFDSFYLQFHNYFKMFCRALPFTFEAFIRSGFCDLSITGLAIDLADFNASDDQIKVNECYGSPNWNFYQNAAMQFGFRIDKHCPWRIVADLNSPAMQKYLVNRGFKNASRVIRGGYEPAYLLGYNAFKGMITEYYNTYVARRPAVIGPKRNGLGDYVSHRTQRYRVDMFDLIADHGEEYFLEKYVTFRSMEEDEAFTPQRISNITERAMELANVKGMERALRYINEDACKTTRRAGSYAFNHHRRTTRDEEEKRKADAPSPGTLRH